MSASGTTKYKYDESGKRFYMQRGTATTFYVFNGDELIGEVTNGVPTYAYTWGPDGLVSQRNLATSSSLWYHYGPQGETRQLTNAAGATADTYLYDAYGKPISSTGTDVNPFRYGGKVGYYYDGNASGFVLAGQRWYSPHLMRWLSRDPIEYEGGDNTYAYVMGNPVRFLDPSGLIVQNGSDGPVVVKPEDGPSFLLPPGFEWPGSPDGVWSPKDKKWRKVKGKKWLPDNDVCVTKDDDVRCTRGPCRYFPPYIPEPDELDDSWKVPENWPSLPVPPNAHPIGSTRTTTRPNMRLP